MRFYLFQVAALVAGLILSQGAARADKLEVLWQLAPGDREYVTADNTQRGIAYNPATKNLLIVSRAGGNRVVVLNAQTGEYRHDLPYDAGVIYGGTFAVNMIGVADDGAVFVGNLAQPTTNPVGPPNFKLYRWASDDPEAYPELVYEGDPADGASNQRWGDSLDVRGAGVNTQVVIGSRASDRVVVFTSVDGMSFSPTIIGGAAGGTGTLGIAFGDGDTLWSKLTSQPLRQVAFDLAKGTATLLHSFTTPAIPSGITPIGVSGKYLGGILVDSGLSTANGPDSFYLYDLSNLSSPPVLIDQQPFPANNANGNFVGAVDFGDGLVFALDTNCGLVGYRIAVTLEPVEILAQPPSLTVLEGSPVALSVGAKGTPPLEYQWYQDGNPLAGANQSVLALPRVRTDQAGDYSVRVRNQVNEVESASATLTVVPVVQSDALTLKWTLRPGDRPWLQADDRQRGLAYNPANGHLLVLSRTPSEGIHVLDGLTGQELHQLTIDGSFVTGGTFSLDMIAVANDGAVYAGNLTTTAPSPPFKLYRWEDDRADTLPTVAFEGDPANGISAQRWTDAMDSRGQGADTQVLISSRFGKLVALLTTADGVNFLSTPMSVDDAVDGQFGLGLAFGEGNQFFGKQTGSPLRLVEFDPNTTATTTVREYTLDQIPGSVFALAYDAKNKFLAALSLETGDNLRLYDLADPANPVLIDQELFPTDNPNINGTGAADFGGDMLFALDSNNGIMAFTVKRPSSPATLADPQVNGANFDFTVRGVAGVTYDLEGSTDLKTWTAVAGVSGIGPSFVASIPMAGYPYRFFRAVPR